MKAFDGNTVYNSSNTDEFGLLNSSPLKKLFLKHGIEILNRGGGKTHTVNINGVEHECMYPVTFTPYASASPCSARCWFCSENLQASSECTNSSMLRPGQHYHEYLQNALACLKNLPLGLSMSGLEITDNEEWLTRTVDILKQRDENGNTWIEKSAYTNGAGLVGDKGERIMACLGSMCFDRVELSRHHFDQDLNQNIMRFRSNESIQNNSIFTHAIKKGLDYLSLSLVCIIQRGGVENLEGLQSYIDWAKTLGIKKIIFRELCDLPGSYTNNKTYRLIGDRRVSIEPIVESWINERSRDIKKVVNGYYFWNVTFDSDGVDIVFERSDYALMNFYHREKVIRKLVFFANGNLCADWNHESRVLARFG